jgi:hypothetical protein
MRFWEMPFLKNPLFASFWSKSADIPQNTPSRRPVLGVTLAGTEAALGVTLAGTEAALGVTLAGTIAAAAPHRSYSRF